MINLQLYLYNPWSDKFSNVKSKAYKVTKNKILELQICRTNDIINLQFIYTTQTDHAGVTIELGFLSYNLLITFCDNRHWDYFNKRWENYENTNCQTSH
jgi:hypothetical protein